MKEGSGRRVQAGAPHLRQRVGEGETHGEGLACLDVGGGPSFQAGAPEAEHSHGEPFVGHERHQDRQHVAEGQWGRGNGAKGQWGNWKRGQWGAGVRGNESVACGVSGARAVGRCRPTAPRQVWRGWGAWM